MSEQSNLSTFDPATNARCRALVLQAINAKPGMTYPEIRDWIRENRRFVMEDVGRRVRELARESKPAYARIEQDENGRVHVYPTEKE